MHKKTQREQWQSRLGFVWAAVGSAVGLGSIWLFPYKVGTNGGAAYIILYLVCLFLVGFPVLLSELLMGRFVQRNAVDVFSRLGRQGAWRWAGLMTILTGVLVSAFYAVVAGWTLGYFVEALVGQLQGLTSPEAAAAHFTSRSSSAFWALSFVGAFLCISLAILYAGVRRGIERSSQWMMPLLLLVLLFLAIRGLFMPDAGAGIRFIFAPDFSQLTRKAVLLALGQAFFALSLGQGTMVTYGSYLSKKTNLPAICVPIAVFGVAISLLAGIAIFTIVFSFGLSPTFGEGLMFQTLPLIFSKLPGGAFLSVLFFFLLCLAALTSQISAMEPLIAYLIDVKRWSRRQAVLTTGACVVGLAVLAALSFGPLKTATLFGYTFFEILLFSCLHVLIPLGGLAAVLLVGWRWGIRASSKHLKEGAEGFFDRYPLFPYYFRFSIQVIAPAAILLVMFDAFGWTSFL